MSARSILQREELIDGGIEAGEAAGDDLSKKPGRRPARKGEAADRWIN
jgi:hypothetical protein